MQVFIKSILSTVIRVLLAADHAYLTAVAIVLPSPERRYMQLPSVPSSNAPCATYLISDRSPHYQSQQSRAFLPTRAGWDKDKGKAY